MTLDRGFDQRNGATLLQAFLHSIGPPGLKGIHEIGSGIHKWESEVAALRSRCKKALNHQSKSAILISMLPKEYQDMTMPLAVGRS